MKELSETNLQLSKKIVATIEEGNEYEESGKFSQAFEKYKASWSMLPAPQNAWDLSHWIAKCMSGLSLKTSDFKTAKDWALVAVETKPPRETSSLIILGASYLGLHENDHAKELLKKAFVMGGDRAFQGFDKKYLAFLKGL
ncbi:hypothetical protein [Pseudomonas sp. KU43P]|uniref:hypothetical protein n=1 Tax=Pseudomonas sp. KU43P TaxID=2487887 RepID=UPI0012A7E0AD|nr:hypothetical protein [Pseudomonas sp. KU43P]BBH44886.1 hypothetical protein KU43P_13630 [Pseudomonas sp. KU43P]